MSTLAGKFVDEYQFPFLTHELTIYTAKADALGFIGWKKWADMDELRANWAQRLEHKTRALLDAGEMVSRSEKAVLYHISYLDEMKSLYQQMRAASTFTFEIMTKICFVHGQRDGYKFAISHDGNENAIQGEIAEITEIIAEGVQSGRGSAAPTASPRIHNDGYLRGLADAIDLLTRAKSGEPLPEVRPSAWFVREAKPFILDLLSKLKAVSSDHEEGRLSGLAFALECEVDILRMQAELEIIRLSRENLPSATGWDEKTIAVMQIYYNSKIYILETLRDKFGF